MMEPTYKDFADYLSFIADLYESYGTELLEAEAEYDSLHDALGKIHPEPEEGAERIYDLKASFVLDCCKYGKGWNNPRKSFENNNHQV